MTNMYDINDSYGRVGPATYREPVDIGRLIRNATELRKENGTIAVNRPPEACHQCHQTVMPVQAYVWGEIIEGFLMSGLPVHQCPPRDEFGLLAYKESAPPVYAEHVILLQGTPLAVSRDEHALYLRDAKLGRFPIIIRSAVIDRVYPTIPYGEWAENEIRRGKNVDRFLRLN